MGLTPRLSWAEWEDKLRLYKLKWIACCDICTLEWRTQNETSNSNVYLYSAVCKKNMEKCGKSDYLNIFLILTFNAQICARLCPLHALGNERVYIV